MKVMEYDGKGHSVNSSHRKENGFSESYTGLAFSRKNAIKVREVCVLSIYWTKSTCFACLSVNDEKPNNSTGGSGKVGDNWNHMPSAAAQEAITNAGYTLDFSIADRGNGGIKDAVEAICRHYYPAHYIYVVHAHP